MCFALDLCASENPDLNGSVVTPFVVDVKRVVGHPPRMRGVFWVVSASSVRS